MSDPVRNHEGKQVARRVGNKIISLDGKKSYDLDADGNLRDPETGKIVGHLQNSDQYVPDGKLSPDIF